MTSNYWQLRRELNHNINRNIDLYEFQVELKNYIHAATPDTAREDFTREWQKAGLEREALAHQAETLRMLIDQIPFWEKVKALFRRSQYC